jgi:hypothetical protein
VIAKLFKLLFQSLLLLSFYLFIFLSFYLLKTSKEKSAKSCSLKEPVLENPLFYKRKARALPRVGSLFVSRTYKLFESFESLLLELIKY